jgi:hypothetical protein
MLRLIWFFNPCQAKVTDLQTQQETRMCQVLRHMM